MMAREIARMLMREHMLNGLARGHSVRVAEVRIVIDQGAISVYTDAPGDGDDRLRPRHRT